MKRFYNEPLMNISLFSGEDIVTSGSSVAPPEPQAQSGIEKATKALNDSGVSQVVTVTW